MMTLNEQMSLLRKTNGYTQKQISDLLNIARATYASYETGRTRPDVSLLQTFAGIFGVTVDYVLHLDENSIYHLRDTSSVYVTDVFQHPLLSDLSDDEKLLVGAYRLKQPEQQKEMLKTFLPPREK